MANNRYQYPILLYVYGSVMYNNTSVDHHVTALSYQLLSFGFASIT